MTTKNLSFSFLLSNKHIFKWLLFVATILVLSSCADMAPALDQTAGNELSQPIAAAPQPTQKTVQKSSEYRIGPEDVLQISVWREETLDRKVIVRPDGGISFPLVGDMQAAGKTPEQVQSEIREKLKKYLPEPVVTVSVDQVTGYRIYVLGKVNKPGQYTVGRYVDVLQALTLAGGLTPYASENNIKILRRENGNQITLPFEYSAVRGGRNLDQNIILRNDDVVVVP